MPTVSSAMVRSPGSSLADLSNRVSGKPPISNSVNVCEAPKVKSAVLTSGPAGRRRYFGNMTELELLQSFTRENSQAAFATLVER